MRVVVADPPAYTPPYDRSLCRGARARGSRRRARHVALSLRRRSLAPEGYDAREWFYPLSSRMRGTRLRLAVKALEHPFGMARFAATKPDVIHMQWLGAPELDRWLFHPRSPAVLHRARHHPAAHALQDGDVAHRCSDGSSASSCTPSADTGSSSTSALPEAKLRVIGHPVFRSEIDAGRRRANCSLPRPHPAVQGN